MAVIDLAAGWFDPANQSDDELLSVTRAHMSEQDALLLGRTTFESFRSYWPKQIDDSTGIAAHLNRVQKYVLSTTLQDPEWEPTTISDRQAGTQQLAVDKARLLTGALRVM